MLLPLTKLPAKILRAPVADIQFPLDKATRRLLFDMLETVQVENGIGLAAPQIGKSLNLAVIFLVHQNQDPFFICNPKIVEASKGETEIEEGCLSIPGIYGMVSRPKKITVEYFDIKGEKQTLTDDDWTARVLLHEIDHLHGKLIVDKFNKITKGEELLGQFRAKG